jgi:hypothetical protein
MSSSARRRMRLGVVPRSRVVVVHLRLRSRGSPGENLVRGGGGILAGGWQVQGQKGRHGGIGCHGGC